MSKPVSHEVLAAGAASVGHARASRTLIMIRRTMRKLAGLFTLAALACGSGTGSSAPASGTVGGAAFTPAEVVASSNDQDLETHVRLSRFMIERCRRMVESKRDVFVLLDSITRVARAYNSVHGGSGRTMTGGVDARALEIPRKIFAAARKIEEGGSLTHVATALVDTGSRMDELIFQ